MRTIYPDKWEFSIDDEDENFDLPRHIDKVKCECGGIANRVDSTPEEIKNLKINCGRSYACCCRAFVCEKCGTRLVGQANAPEPE
jgi:hypothetical protein